MYYTGMISLLSVPDFGLLHDPFRARTILCAAVAFGWRRNVGLGCKPNTCYHLLGASFQSWLKGEGVLLQVLPEYAGTLAEIGARVLYHCALKVYLYTEYQWKEDVTSRERIVRFQVFTSRVWVSPRAKSCLSRGL